MTTVVAAPTTLAVGVAARALAEVAPDLLDPFQAELPRAVDIVSRRLLAAIVVEGLGPAPAGATRHALGRVEVPGPVGADPARLLYELVGGRASVPVAAELSDATVNLAIALARRRAIEAEVRDQALWRTGVAARDTLDLAATMGADEQVVFFERLATEGHNLHPCGRTRLGWRVPDVLAHDLESPLTSVQLVAVRRDHHIGADLGEWLAVDGTLVDHDRFAVTPVHSWQLRHVLLGRHADLVRDGVLRPLDVVLPARPTASLRTLLIGHPRAAYVKVSLDIQVTSSRRTISTASAHNGPILSTLIERCLDSDRVLLLPEPAGSATRAGDGRDLTAIVRGGLAGRLAPGEVAVPGLALYAASPITGSSILAELVDRFARQAAIVDRSAAALAWLRDYAGLVLPPLLRLATRHGLGMEAHLQNCIPTFVEGVPTRLVLRDLAGLRLHPARLAGGPPPLWPGSVIVTDRAEVMLAKLAYTVLPAHLGELVLRLHASHGLDEGAAWRVVRDVVDATYDGLGAQPRARADHAFLTAPTLPHKALLRMRLAPADGDHYVPVENPLR